LAEQDREAGDPYGVYDLGDGIYWVGFADWKAGFSNNPYLLTDGDEAVLIDPGSLLHYHVVAKKVARIVRPEQITTIIVQHQDPDLCASIPKFEALIGHPVRVLAHPRAALFVPYYGFTSKVIGVTGGQTVELLGRPFQFFGTPYVHFAGAIVTWDSTTGTLFASDVFAALTSDWRLFADEGYVEATRAFAEPYVGSKEAWQSALKLVRSLRPKIICPQHGSIIDRNIDEYLDALEQFSIGTMLDGDSEGPRA